jgi:tetratricopeptide (TPR) repeat protein
MPEPEMKEEEFDIKKLFFPLTNLKAIHWIIVIGIIVYANMLFNGFVWDDISYILLNPDVHTLNILYLFGSNHFNTIGQYRPIPAVYFSVLYSLFSDNTFFYHLIQLVLHITNVILLYILFKYFFNKKISYFLSLVFFVHPMQVESVSYISQTPSILFFSFGIVALLLYKKREGNIKTSIIIFTLLLLSVLTKESGILFAAQLYLWQILYKKRIIMSEYVYGICMGFIYLFFRLVIGGITSYKSVVVPIDTLSLSQRILNIPAIIFYYLKTFFYPQQLVVDQVWIVKSTDFSSFYLPFICISIFFVLLLIFGIYLAKKKHSLFKAYLYFLVWFVLGLFPYLQILPLDMTVADRWFYYPMVGLLGIIGVLLQLFTVKNEIYKKTIIVIGVIILVLLSTRTIIRNMNWGNAYTLFTHDSRVLDNYNIEANLSSEYRTEGNYYEAIYHMQKSVTFLPYETNLTNLGVLYEEGDKFNLARRYYLLAINAKSLWYPIHQHDVGTYINIITFFIRHNDLINAKKYETLALQDYPDNQDIFLMNAFLEEKLGNHQEAINAAQKANQLGQTNYSEEIYLNLINNKSIEGYL